MADRLPDVVRANRDRPPEGVVAAVRAHTRTAAADGVTVVVKMTG